MEHFFAYIDEIVQLNEEEKSILQANISERTYRKGQYITQEGDICRYVSFIVTGKVRTFYLDKTGNEHIVSFGIENWWVGDVGSFITQTPADFNVECLEVTTVIQMSYEVQQRLFLEIPKIERLFRVIMQRAYASAQKRIVRNFSLTAKERYLLFCEQYPEIVQRVPQYMIASYLGITKEFLSYIRNQSVR